MSAPTPDKSAQVEEMASAIQFGGVLHRFHRTELKPISFGMRQDVALVLGCFWSTFTVCHLVSILLWIFEKKKGFNDYVDSYFQDKPTMTGLLLACWFLGYSIVSLAIYAQFERSLERDAPPDDFEFVTIEEALDNGLAGSKADLMDGHESKMASQTLLVTMPSGELIIGTNTRSQSQDSLMLLMSQNQHE
jgi:hypothetical protein